MLPVPAFTVISGGKHAGNNLAIQVVFLLHFHLLDMLIIHKEGKLTSHPRDWIYLYVFFSN
ncbi:putative phosphopyruvate hydratase [Lupinus albus]|uniref:phosphopyruvate hydratase n=1 Tax=Lupinus albus TaxID=3870 RepID=A0A6A4QMJ1_LUPAL|nr:putative phosphopyruvate hydratase [Lupinus albus]